MQRENIRKLLASLDFVEAFHDADGSGGGWGATVVVFRVEDECDEERSLPSQQAQSDLDKVIERSPLPGCTEPVCALDGIHEHGRCLVALADWNGIQETSVLAFDSRHARVDC